MAFVIPALPQAAVARRARAPVSPRTPPRPPTTAACRAARTVRCAALDAPVKEDVRTSLNRIFAMPTTAEPVTEPERARVRADPGKMYKVMLLNDEGNERSYVARVIQKVCPEISAEQAWAIMMKAHKDGCAVVGIYSFEHAEMICQMLRDNGLMSEIAEV
jgi:ATP-dependent Clp protease adaptor protein ClpS